MEKDQGRSARAHAECQLNNCCNSCNRLRSTRCCPSVKNVRGWVPLSRRTRRTRPRNLAVNALAVD